MLKHLADNGGLRLSIFPTIPFCLIFSPNVYAISPNFYTISPNSYTIFTLNLHFSFLVRMQVILTLIKVGLGLNLESVRKFIAGYSLHFVISTVTGYI